MATGLTVVWLAGCGGTPESPTPPAPVAPPVAEAAAPPAAPAESATAPSDSTAPTPIPPTPEPPDGDETASPPTTAAAPAATSGQGGAGAADTGLTVSGSSPPPVPVANAAEKKPRPERFADWKPADYLSAKQDRDPRLPQAIYQLGAGHVGDASIVETLAAVLRWTPAPQQPAAEASPDSSGVPQGLSIVGGAGAGGNAATMSFGGEAMPGGPMGPNQEVLAATVGALVLNNTDPARKVLRDVVTGELLTDNDQAAVPMSLRGLLGQPTPENEALILSVLVEPEKVRKGAAAAPSPGPMDAMAGAAPPPLSVAELRAQAVPLVDEGGSEPLRVKLMQYLLSDRATPAQRTELVPLLSKPRRENLDAQLLVYQASVQATQLKPAFEKYFTELSSIALGHALGVLADKKPDAAASPVEPGRTPDGGWGGIKAEGEGMGGGPAGLTTSTGGGGAAVSMGAGPAAGPAGYGLAGPTGSSDTDAARAQLDDPAVIYPVARKLWDAAVARAVADRTQQVAALDSQNTTLSLARTMPLDQVRAGMYKLFATHFNRGPGSLVAESGFGGMGGGTMEFGGAIQLGAGLGAPGAVDAPKTFCDPGMLLVIKSLPFPREEKSKRGSASRRAPSASGLQLGGGEGNTALGGTEPEPTNPSEQWLKASETLLVQLCQQCRAAAVAPDDDAKAADEKMPLRLHSRAKIVARYDLTWPADAAGKLGDFKLDPIDVHYVRIEEENQYSRLEKHYRRLGKPRQRPFGTGGVRFDAMRDAKTPGYKLSTDVLLTRSGGGAGLTMDAGAMGRGRQKEPFEAMVVEVLTIEMKDPTGASPAGAASTAPAGAAR